MLSSCFQKWKTAFRGTHETISHFFAEAKKWELCLLGGSPSPTARTAYAALPNAPRVERLRAFASAERRGTLPAGKGLFLMIESVRWTRNRPVGAMKRAVAGGFFVVWVQPPTIVLQERIYSCSACHDCFVWD